MIHVRVLKTFSFEAFNFERLLTFNLVGSDDLVWELVRDRATGTELYYLVMRPCVFSNFNVFRTRAITARAILVRFCSEV